MSEFIDLTGQKFGRLTVIQRVPNKKDKIMWLCKCICGTEIVCAGNHLKSGDSRSCGCYRREKRTTHSMTNSRLYSIWENMKTRCNNPQSKRYKDYGERGIHVCDLWANDFVAFHEWAISNGYSDDLTIDRINVNGDYTPENCRWITLAEQNINKRNNVFLTYNGITQTLSWWANELNVYKSTIGRRHKKGWSDEECLFGRRC